MDGKTYPITHTDAEWRQILTPEQYDVMRLHAGLFSS
jgi:peptide-methionine (R)-S-oxide reductase